MSEREIIAADKRWTSVQIVTGYQLVEAGETDEVFAEEQSFAVYAETQEELWDLADKVLEDRAPIINPDGSCSVAIRDQKEPDYGYPAKPLGARLRRLTSFASTEYLGRPEKLTGNFWFPEANYRCMIFQSVKDFELYANGKEGDEQIMVRMYTDPNHYLFMPI